MQPQSSRTILFVVALWIGVALAIFATERARSSFLESVTDTQMAADRDTWSVIHDLTDDTLVNSVTDYTFWDDMAEFAEGKRNLDWAIENLAPGLESFDIDALWVYDAGGNLRYSASQNGDELGVPPPLPLDKAALEKLVATPDDEYGVMHEFYWFSEMGPLTVVGSDITSTDDPEHLLPGRGYYFAAKLLTMEHGLSALSEIDATGTPLQLTSVPDETAPSTSEPHVFWHRMWDQTGATIGAIRIERNTESFRALLSNSSQGRTVALGLWVLTGVITTWLIVLLGRTRQRAEELALNMTQQLKDTNAALEQRVRERTAELEADVKQRTEAEERLQKRTEELERLNKVMVDRELRVVELKRKLKETGADVEAS